MMRRPFDSAAPDRSTWKGAHNWIAGAYDRNKHELNVECLPPGDKPTVESAVSFVKRHVQVGTTVATDLMVFGIYDKPNPIGEYLYNDDDDDEKPKFIDLSPALKEAGFDHITVDLFTKIIKMMIVSYIIFILHFFIVDKNSFPGLNNSNYTIFSFLTIGSLK
jgi:hypothetical protein